MRYIAPPPNYASIERRILNQESPKKISSKENVQEYLLTGIALGIGYHLSTENPKGRKIHWVRVGTPLAEVARDLSDETGLHIHTVSQWLRREVVAGRIDGFTESHPDRYYVADIEATKTAFRIHVQKNKEATVK